MAAADEQIETDLTQKEPALKKTLFFVALAALWFVLCRHLSGEWSVNEQYSYAWFVPFFAAFLFWLRWEDRPAAGSWKSDPVAAAVSAAGRPPLQATRLPPQKKCIAVAVGLTALLILLPVRLFEVANPDWRPLGWLHAAAVVTLTLLVIWLAGGKPWLRHFAFPVCFFFVAVPWVTPIEQPIVQGLMRSVAAVATEVLTLCGIPAQLEGSLIRVNSGLVGVNEACSGVRSLQTSIMIGLLFGELKRLSVPRRFGLLLGALAIAIVANFIRAFFLVWIAATRSISAVAEWHDFAGYAIVGVVFLGSLGLAALLGKGGRRKAEGGPPASRFILHPSCFILSLAWLVAVELGVEGWYRVHEENLAAHGLWSVHPPEKASGFREIKIDENVRQMLRFDIGREVTWKTNGTAPLATNYIFFFRWNSGSASVLRARSHRPEICLPNIGWTLVADLGTKNYPGAGEISIVARHVSFRQSTGNVVAHTFFCLQEDKVHPNEQRPDLEAEGVQPERSVPARVRVVRDGIRNLGQQVMETILISSPGMDDEGAEARFQELVREVVEAK
jgi:exosortase